MSSAKRRHRRRYRPEANARRFWTKRVAEFARKWPSGPKSQPYEFRMTGYFQLRTGGPARHL